VFIALLDIISSKILLSGFDELESQVVRQNVERVKDAINESLVNLTVACGDYAQWDDTCVYVENQNEEYVSSNLVATTFVQQKLNFLIIVNASGKVLFKKGMDWRNVHEVPVPDEFINMIVPGNPLITFANTTGKLAGMISLPQGIMLLASHPILTSDAQGPIRGAVIFGRYLDEKEAERIGKITHMALVAVPMNAPNLPEEFQSMETRLTQPEKIEVVPMGEKNIAGYTIVNDIFNNPCLMFKVEAPRSVYAQGLISQRYMVCSLIVIAILFCTSSVLLLEKIVLHRLSRLSNGICSIGDKADFSARVPMEGNDELKKVALAVNEMLDALEWTQHERMESRERYLAVVRQVSDGIFLFDQKLQLIEANPAFEKLFGYTDEEIPHLKFSDINILPVDQIKEGLEVVQETQSILTGERQYYHKNGTVIDVEMSINAISLPEKELFCVVVRDITERKQAQEALKRAKDELELRVQQRTAELAETNEVLRAEITEHQQAEAQLRKARDAAEAAAKTKSEFLTNMSHEIRTPMNGIIGMTDLVLETPLTPQQQEYLDVVKNSAESLLMILNDILEYSKIEAGNLVLQPTDFRMTECLDSMVRVLALRAQSKDIELSCNIQNDVPDLMTGDPDCFRQIIMNIVGNAIKFTHHGYVRMVIEKLYDDNREVCLHFAVEDSGVGIPEDKQKQIFDAFSQADGSSTRKYGGTGMGLALSSKLIELMGGKIWVESPVKNKLVDVGGVGSTFHFTLRFGVPKQIPSQIVAGNSHLTPQNSGF
jgi:PAS domain S-box-containing protein